MTRPRIPPKHRAAIGVAVVGLVAGALDVAAAKAPPKSCHSWAAATVRGADRVGEQAGRDFIINALAQACGAIPEQLRRAAVEIRRVKDPSERARILATAASATLGSGCSVVDPFADARQVASTCPLPPLPSNFAFRPAEGELQDMRAVDYLIMNALLRGFIGANQFDESAERVILQLTLSAEINGEDFRARASRRKPPAATDTRGDCRESRHRRKGVSRCIPVGEDREPAAF
jgi:hypothetical protein